MSTDIHVRVARYNKNTNLYEELQLFRKRKEKEYDYDPETGEHLPWSDFKEIHINLGRHYEMFDGMKEGDEEDGYGCFPWTSINFLSLESSFAEKIKKEMDFTGTFDFHEITLADIYNYLHFHPLVTDYEGNWEDWKPGDPKPKKENPIKDATEKIERFISLADDNYDFSPYSYYKIIFYFDC